MTGKLERTVLAVSWRCPLLSERKRSISFDSRLAASVKVCGCRPHEGGAADTGAGVRKPPKEETAGGVARMRVRRYGDFGAGGLVRSCVERSFGKRSRG